MECQLDYIFLYGPDGLFIIAIERNVRAAYVIYLGKYQSHQKNILIILFRWLKGALMMLPIYNCFAERAI